LRRTLADVEISSRFSAAWPLEQPGRPHLVAAFLKGLGETGYVEGRSVDIEYRWARDER
jgi:hypothetical protein